MIIEPAHRSLHKTAQVSCASCDVTMDVRIGDRHCTLSMYLPKSWVAGRRNTEQLTDTAPQMRAFVQEDPL